MFIQVVEAGIERLIREQLPLSEEVGDITFEAPTSNWSAQLSRVTVSLFLYDVSRSNHPMRSTMRRGTDSGVGQRRTPQPMVMLSYLCSAWAGTVKDEHILLGDLISRLMAIDTLPPELLPQELSSSAQLGFAEDSANKLREIWSGLGGQLKASFTMQVHVAADTFEWVDAAPPVERVEGLAAPVPWTPTESGSNRAIDKRRVPGS